ncbi:MAG: hypothetical protein K2N22_04735 [Clostridia bacterium]|nr:hypothetical protein [Clostridia bacterium]
MKDKELEKVFNGYFEGVNTPDNLTKDAKKHVKKRSAFLPALAKYGSVAAGAVLIVAVSVVLVSRANLFGPKESGGAPAPLTYTDADISASEANAYALTEKYSSLKFLEELAYSRNAAVNSVEIAAFDDGKPAHARAEISVISNARYDAEVYVEFTDYVYEPLLEYAQGTSGYYRGINYTLTRTTDEATGELATTLFAQKNGVKYYFNVLSSDRDSYIKCLQMIL